MWLEMFNRHSHLVLLLTKFNYCLCPLQCSLIGNNDHGAFVCLDVRKRRWRRTMEEHHTANSFLFLLLFSCFACCGQIAVVLCRTLSKANVELTGMLFPRIDSSQGSGARCNFPLLSFIDPSPCTWAKCQWPWRMKDKSYFKKRRFLYMTSLMVTDRLCCQYCCSALCAASWECWAFYLL